jgi:rod shape determining protein RodA
MHPIITKSIFIERKKNNLVGLISFLLYIKSKLYVLNIMRYSNPQERLILSRIHNYNWALVFIIISFSLIGVALLYSAAQGSFEPWALKQLYTIATFAPIMLLIGLVDIKIIYKSAYPLYILGIIFLIIAEITGHKAMGAQRWIRVGFINFQPSEIMKLFVILVLAKYFHDLHSQEIGKIQRLIYPLILIFIPTILILKQPNLGTAIITVGIGGALFFCSGVRAWKFIAIIVTAICAAPVVWNFMHDYQKQRVLTFLDPESDRLGAGYNILQSMIAIGSGGTTGKGFMKGTQSQLDFLPEKQTDFIFTVLAEDFGFIGVLAIFVLSFIIIVYGYLIAMSIRNHFGRLVVYGVTTMFGLHLIINTAMISGSIPVVGTPFPFLSYGGSNLITMLISYGVVLSALANKNESLTT